MEEKLSNTLKTIIKMVFLHKASLVISEIHGFRISRQEVPMEALTPEKLSKHCWTIFLPK
jgi:hypothetical protein